MAAYAAGVNAAEAVKLWGTKTFHETIAKTFFGKFMGKGSENLVQFLTDTQKVKGDRVRVTLRNLLSGAGVSGTDTLEGNEEGLTVYTDNLNIDNLRHAARADVVISEQRVPFETREEMRMGMEDWWAERLDTALANQLTGNTDESDLKKTGLNATVAPTSANSVTRIIVGGGEGSEASLSATTTHAIKLSDLDRAVAYAKVQTPRIRQIRVDGSERFVTFLHPYAIYQMRRDASTAGNFFDVQKAMLQGGKISDNPIVTGASFVYNNVIVHEWAYLPDVAAAVSSSASYRRGVFCGAQAAVLAVGMKDSPTKMRWVEEYFDYEEQLGVAVGMVHGIKKTQFNSVDFGTIVLSGYAPAP
jgi:N4-gp56 family major capsid protein